jgi:acyl dehydratase
MRRMCRRKIDRHILPAINYGLDTVRFRAPVLSTSRGRLTATVAEASDVESGVQVIVDCVFRVEGQEPPARVARAVLRHHFTT